MGQRCKQLGGPAIKVLLASSGSGSRGGGEIFIDYLGQGLSSRGHEVTTWMPAHPRIDELAARCARFGRVVRAEYVNTYDYIGRSLTASLDTRSPVRIAREWQRLDPDVIHVNKQNLEDGLELLRAASLSLRPTVCTIHLTQSAHYLGARAAILRDWLARRALVKYRGVLVAVQPGREASLQAFMGRRVRTAMVYNGAPLVSVVGAREVRENHRRALGIGAHELLVVGLGRLVAQKRPMTFLETAAELHARQPDVRFLWVGDGNMRAQWDEWVAQRGLSKVIRCAGWQAETLPYLLAADALLHVAEFEGLPLALIEAMATGVTCIVSAGFASEIPLLTEDNVILAGDSAALAARIGDRELMQTVAVKGRQLAEKHFSLDAMAQSYERLYENAAADHSLL